MPPFLNNAGIDNLSSLKNMHFAVKYTLLYTYIRHTILARLHIFNRYCIIDVDCVRGVESGCTWRCQCQGIYLMLLFYDSVLQQYWHFIAVKRPHSSVVFICIFFYSPWNKKQKWKPSKGKQKAVYTVKQLCCYCHV